MSKVAIFLADGSEPIEALAPADALRRAGVEVSLVSINEGTMTHCAHGINVDCDTTLASYDFADCDLVVLPGGMPGTTNLRNNEQVCEVVKEFAATKKVAAICAAPSIFAELGLLEGHACATCYPGFEKDFPVGIRPAENGVYVDGNMVTASGPGFALPFGFELIRQLEGVDAAKRVSDGMLY